VNTRIAIIDLGTNTFHLLVADVKGTRFKNVYKTKDAVKLGEGAIHKKFIAEIPFERGIRTLINYKKKIDELHPVSVHAYATSAVRSARNGQEFVDTVRSRTNIPVNVISGLREAELICAGVRQCISLRGNPVLIMDIGGGSIEFIIADDKKIFWKKSFDIGAARLLEIFKPSDPVTTTEIEMLEKFLDKELLSLKRALKKFPVSKLIGSSGSFDTFAEMAGWRFHNKDILLNKKSYNFNMNEFNALYEQVVHSTLKQRLRMKGLIRMRVDMIVLAGICTNYVLKTFGIKKMQLSKFALKEGALWEVINKPTTRSH
jgi:exopolyphosphatase/guanosine-5'-triphosphate,3'-diphosphate pyrophosphatase